MKHAQNWIFYGINLFSIIDCVKEDHSDTADLCKNRTKWVFLCGNDWIFFASRPLKKWVLISKQSSSVFHKSFRKRMFQQMPVQNYIVSIILIWNHDSITNVSNIFTNAYPAMIALAIKKKTIFQKQFQMFTNSGAESCPKHDVAFSFSLL